MRYCPVAGTLQCLLHRPGDRGQGQKTRTGDGDREGDIDSRQGRRLETVTGDRDSLVCT